jgi:hypothetical protein
MGSIPDEEAPSRSKPKQTAVADDAIIEEIPHNAAARIAVPFWPSAACKFLDLP